MNNPHLAQLNLMGVVDNSKATIRIMDMKTFMK